MAEQLLCSRLHLYLTGRFRRVQTWNRLHLAWPREFCTVVLFLIPVLILALIAVVPTWPYSKSWSYYPAGGMGAILALTIALLVFNRI